MASKFKEVSIDHNGVELPSGLAGMARKDTGEIVSYKARWDEEDENGIRRQPSKSFSIRKLGSADQALEEATNFLKGAREIVKVGGAVAKPDAARALVTNEVFQEWVVGRGPEVSEDYAKKAVRLWAREIEWRPIGRTRLDRISEDPETISRFQNELRAEGLRPAKRREILKLFRAVMRWGRRQHPGALTVELSGLIDMPKHKRTRLAYAPDAVGVERIIEAVLKRPARDDLLPLRDAALIAAQGYTVASRPSEWRLSAHWDDLYSPVDESGIGTVEFQRQDGDDDYSIPGLKTGAHVALLLPNASERIALYRNALEERFGPQPGNGLVFQVIGPDGPVWITPEGGKDPLPLAWTRNNYNQWVKRVWNPAREIAAQAPDAPPGLARMVFYDLRHFAISIALHSTLVVGPHGMNLHPLAGWAGHDIQTLERYYRHFIARYMGKPPIDIAEECRQARESVEANPFQPKDRVSPQREEQRRRRVRVAAQRHSQRGAKSRRIATHPSPSGARDPVASARLLRDTGKITAAALS